MDRVGAAGIVHKIEGCVRTDRDGISFGCGVSTLPYSDGLTLHSTSVESSRRSGTSFRRRDGRSRPPIRRFDLIFAFWQTESALQFALPLRMRCFSMFPHETRKDI